MPSVPSMTMTYVRVQRHAFLLGEFLTFLAGIIFISAVSFVIKTLCEAIPASLYNGE